MTRRWLIIFVAGFAIVAVAATAWPLTHTEAAAIAKAALLRDGVAIEAREHTEIHASDGITLVSFGVIDGFDYVVQVSNRWSRGEVHRMPADGG